MRRTSPAENAIRTPNGTFESTAKEVTRSRSPLPGGSSVTLSVTSAPVVTAELALNTRSSFSSTTRYFSKNQLGATCRRS
jgi:hypothetical protein